MCVCIHGKNDFTEVSKNFTIDTDLKIILSNYQNNYVRHSSMISKSFDILGTNSSVCVIILMVQKNYFQTCI